MTDDPYSPTELANAAADWFASLGGWPQETVEAVTQQNIQAKTETAGYYGVQAALLMLIAIKSGWPPMSPKAFAAELRDPSKPDGHVQIARYAKNIRAVEGLHGYEAPR